LGAGVTGQIRQNARVICFNQDSSVHYQSEKQEFLFEDLTMLGNMQHILSAQREDVHLPVQGASASRRN
jgi:hypothetical protein